MAACCVGSTVESSAGGVMGCVSGVGWGQYICGFGCIIVRWVDGRTIQYVDRWEVWRLGGGVRGVSSEEDLGHFLNWEVSYWAHSWHVCNDNQWSVSDGGECAHIRSWIMVVGFCRC